MGFEIKKYSDIMVDMTEQFTASTGVVDIGVGSGVKVLMDALEASMFGGVPTHERGLRKTLGKLGIKSAAPSYSMGLYGGPLQMESLEATLKSVTFDDKNIKMQKFLQPKKTTK